MRRVMRSMHERLHGRRTRAGARSAELLAACFVLVTLAPDTVHRIATGGPGPSLSAQVPPAAAPRAPSEAAAPGTMDPPRSPRNANYSIDAHLDAAARTLTGSELITWRNISSRLAAELRFHLYWNGWKSTRSTFLRERVSRNRPPNDFSGIEVTSIALWPPKGSAAAEPIDLTSARRFIAPDDGNDDDETVMEVPLPEPVEPGETVRIEVKWTARVPRTFDRTGAVGNFFFIAQWFPKLGVLEDGGWNAHQFHAATEFFSDYGVYDVRLTVPRGWTVGATGVERERQDDPQQGTTTHRYYQEDVHDFAWTTSPDYIEMTELFEHPRLPPVTMRLLLQPEHRAQAKRHFDAARTALTHYGEWFSAYPYGHLTIVDPAYQSGADGMEYPTLVTAGTEWLVPPEATSGTPEEVTIHEIDHQFFYGIVGTNEFEHAWMDEGITTYTAARALAQG